MALTSRLDLSCTPDQRQELEQLAEAAGVRLSWLVRELLQQGVEAYRIREGGHVGFDPEGVALLQRAHEDDLVETIELVRAGVTP